MKLLISQIFAFTLLFIPFSNGQVSEDDRAMSQGLYNAVIIDLPQTEVKFAEKCWKDYIKEFKGKTKKNRKADEFVTEECQINGLGESNYFTMYARADETGDDVEIKMWVQYEADDFLSSGTYPDRYAEAEKFMIRYGLYVAKEKTRLEMEEEEKRLKKMEQTLKKLERDNDRYHREIENARDRIAKAESSIEENIIQQDKAKQEIDDQKDAVKEVTKRYNEF